MVVSHDRTFLNNVVTDIVQLTNRKLVTYPGNYDNYLKQKAQRYTEQKRAYDAQQMEREHMQNYIDKFYNEKRSSAQAARVKQAQSKKKALEKMVLIEDPGTILHWSTPAVHIVAICSKCVGDLLFARCIADKHQ